MESFLTISLPIDPAAPVTMDIFCFNLFAMCSSNRLIGALFIKSLISILESLSKLNSTPKKEFIDDISLILILSGIILFRKLDLTKGLRELLAIIISMISFLFTSS